MRKQVGKKWPIKNWFRTGVIVEMKFIINLSSEEMSHASNLTEEVI